MNASLSAICIGCLFSTATPPGNSNSCGPVIEQIANEQFHVTFRFMGRASIRSVAVAGTFNEWRPDRNLMQQSSDGGAWQTTIALPRGRHEYKFVINGDTWVSDPDNPDHAGPHDNAVLMAGVETAPWGDVVVPHNPNDPTDPLAHLPDELQQLQHQLAEAPSQARALHRALDFMRDRTTPLSYGDRACFVWVDAESREANVLIQSAGVIRRIPMAQLGDAPVFFAALLPIGQLEQNAPYRIAFRRGDGWHVQPDPHAWTVTSRGGKPVSVIATPSTNRGRIELITDIDPTARVVARDLYVYLPPGYDDHPQHRYPIIYMHDGQNCWDDPHAPFGHGGWHINETADKLVADGQIEPTIIVGIPNTADRMHELFPKADLLSDETPPYLQYLIRDVKPIIDARYRTRPDPASTFIMGSSLGGCMSFHAVLRHPDIFGAAACLSSAFAYPDDKGQTYVDLAKKLGKQPVRIYLDSGTAGPGQDGLVATQAMRQLLIDRGWQEGTDLLCIRDEGAEHNERYWRARVQQPLEFLLGRGASEAGNR